MTTALIAEDEPLLAAELREELLRQWPELRIEAVVHDGHAALRAIERLRPTVLFLDVQMPGLDGMAVAQVVGGEAHVVFITAYDHYAVQAFEAGAVDYLLKPLDPARLALAIKRLRARLTQPPSDMSQLLARLVEHRPQPPLRFVTVLRGREIQLITVDEICYLRADHKYVAVVTVQGESLVTRSLKDLLGQLDAATFWQIGRSLVVNAYAIDCVYRSLTGRLEIRLKERAEALPVSPSHAHRFKHM